MVEPAWHEATEVSKRGDVGRCASRKFDERCRKRCDRQTRGREDEGNAFGVEMRVCVRWYYVNDERCDVDGGRNSR